MSNFEISISDDGSVSMNKSFVHVSPDNFNTFVRRHWNLRVFAAEYMTHLGLSSLDGVSLYDFYEYYRYRCRHACEVLNVDIDELSDDGLEPLNFETVCCVVESTFKIKSRIIDEGWRTRLVFADDGRGVYV